MKRRKFLLFAAFSFLVAGILGLLSAMPAQASEWYLGALVGGSFPADIDMKSKMVAPSENEVFTYKTKNLDLNNSAVVGAKGGVCPGFFPYLCLELEFDYFWPSIAGQTATNRGTACESDSCDSFSSSRRHKADIRVANLDPMLIARYAFLQAAGYPLGGRLHLYAGVGPAFLWTTAKIKTNEFGIDEVADNLSGKKDTDFAVGVAVPVGIKYFFTKNLAIFAEYKYKHWSPSFKFSATEEGDPFKLTTKTHMNANLVYVGLAWHFLP